MHRILIFSILIFIGCENDIQEVNKFFQERNAAVEKGEGIELIYSDSGNVVLKLRAPIMVRHSESNGEKEEFPKGVKVDFYDKQGKINSHLIADYAVRDPRSDEVIARENVILYNLTGDTLRTDELIWDSDDKRIYTEQFVRISTPKELLYGFGFETDPTFSTYKLKDVSGRMQFENLPKGVQ